MSAQAGWPEGFYCTNQASYTNSEGHALSLRPLSDFRLSCKVTSTAATAMATREAMGMVVSHVRALGGNGAVMLQSRCTSSDSCSCTCTFTGIAVIIQNEAP